MLCFHRLAIQRLCLFGNSPFAAQTDHATLRDDLTTHHTAFLRMIHHGKLLFGVAKYVSR